MLWWRPALPHPTLPPDVDFLSFGVFHFALTGLAIKWPRNWLTVYSSIPSAGFVIVSHESLQMLEGPILRHCKCCDNSKPLSEFYQNKKTGHWNSYCKSCSITKSTEWNKQHPGYVERWRAANPDKVEAYKKAEYLRERDRYWPPGTHRKRKLKRWGMTPERLQQIYDDQGGKCAICKTEMPFLGRGTHMDHCHEGNFFRGILCHNCNKGLGNFKDNPELLSAAVKYLKMHDCS